MKMINEVEYLKRNYNIDGIRFFDPNFFLKIERVREFANALIKDNIDLKWAASGTIQQFRSIDINDLKLMYLSGLRYVEFGIESGDENVRSNVLNKKFTNNDAMKVLRSFSEVGLQFKFNIMLGFPGEQPEQSLKSLDYALDIITKHPNASIGGHLYIYMPFPGTKLYELSCEKGYSPLSQLEEFSNINYSNSSCLPWLSKKHMKMIDVISIMSYFLSASANHIPFKGFKKIAFRMMRYLYIFRLKYKIFMFTPDIKILSKVLY